MPVSKSDFEDKLQEADPKAEERKASEERAGQPPEPAQAPFKGAKASESGDPAVHYLIAEAETARLNGNEERVDALQGRLRELGYEV